MHNLTKALLIAISAYGLSACQHSTASTESAPPPQAPHSYSSYSYIISQQCYCEQRWQQPHLLTVKNGQPIQLTNLSTQKNISLKHAGNEIPTLAQLEAWVSKAQQHKTATLRLKRNPKYQTPQTLHIDWSALISDDEINISIEQFQPL